MCLLGNFMVIYGKIKNLRTRQNTGKEVQIYNILVLNLALADFLMGVYLTGIAIDIKHKVAERQYFSTPEICKVLGVINALSAQVSVTILLIISFYRLTGVMFPYMRQRVKPVIIEALTTWVVWLAIIVLPTLPLQPLTTIFTFGIVKQRRLGKNQLIEFLKFTPMWKPFLTLYSRGNQTEINAILQAINRYPANVSVLKKTAVMLGLVNFELDNWSLVGYYDLQYGCATNFFITNEKTRLFNYFTLSLVSYNFIASVVMLIVYVLVSCEISGNLIIVQLRGYYEFDKQLLRKKTLEETNLSLKHTENKKLFRRISFIVITNLLCWIPLCIAALVISQLSIKDSNDGSYLLTTVLSFETAMMLLVPLNSILNPYIYSYPFWERLFGKIKSMM